MSGETLRDRLAAIYHDPTCPCPTRDEALNFADSMVAVVAEWLRAEADALRVPREPFGDSFRRIEANALDVRAQRIERALTPTPAETTEGGA